MQRPAGCGQRTCVAAVYLPANCGTAAVRVAHVLRGLRRRADNERDDDTTGNQTVSSDRTVRRYAQARNLDDHPIFGDFPYATRIPDRRVCVIRNFQNKSFCRFDFC